MFKPLAHTISIVFHPLMLTIYAQLYVFFGHTMWSVLPLSYKIVTMLYISVGISLLPLLSVVFLYIKHNFSDISFSRTRDRLILLIFTFLSSCLTYYILTHYVIVPMPIIRLVQVQCLASLVAAIITPFWKISLHSIALGVLLIFVCVVGATCNVDFSIEAMAVCAIAGLVGTSRLYLDAHDIWQVAAGVAVGMSSMMLIYVF